MTVEVVPALVRDDAGISVDELDRHALRHPAGETGMISLEAAVDDPDPHAGTR
jgi:hypothetical protein